MTQNKIPFVDVDFRNYANDFLDLDTGTPSGLGRYLEWLEELVCDEEKLQKVKDYITEVNERYAASKRL